MAERGAVSALFLRTASDIPLQDLRVAGPHWLVRTMQPQKVLAVDALGVARAPFFGPGGEMLALVVEELAQGEPRVDNGLFKQASIAEEKHRQVGAGRQVQATASLVMEVLTGAGQAGTSFPLLLGQKRDEEALAAIAEDGALVASGSFLLRRHDAVSLKMVRRETHSRPATQVRSKGRMCAIFSPESQKGPATFVASPFPFSAYKSWGTRIRT